MPLVRARLGINSKPFICKFQFRSFWNWFYFN
jgi:hypothetical protein